MTDYQSRHPEEYVHQSVVRKIINDRNDWRQRAQEQSDWNAAIEAAAKVCWNPPPNYRSAWDRGLGAEAESHEDACKQCAAAIRSLLRPAAQEAEKPAADAVGQAFPERDASKPAEQQGLFRKFDVRRTDGSDQPGGTHYGCRYFVLDMDHDVHAPAALRSYADSCAETHPQLAADLRAEFGRTPTAVGAGGQEAAREQPKRQYYYKVAGCVAEDVSNPACICWHDEGTGPLRNDTQYIKHWREQPAKGEKDA